MSDFLKQRIAQLVSRGNWVALTQMEHNSATSEASASILHDAIKAAAAQREWVSPQLFHAVEALVEQRAVRALTALADGLLQTENGKRELIYVMEDISMGVRPLGDVHGRIESYGAAYVIALASAPLAPLREHWLSRSVEEYASRGPDNVPLDSWIADTAHHLARKSAEFGTFFHLAGLYAGDRKFDAAMDSIFLINCWRAYSMDMSGVPYFKKMMEALDEAPIALQQRFARLITTNDFAAADVCAHRLRIGPVGRPKAYLAAMDAATPSVATGP